MRAEIACIDETIRRTSAGSVSCLCGHATQQIRAMHGTGYDSCVCHVCVRYVSRAWYVRMPAQPRPLLLAQYRQRPIYALRRIRTVGAGASGVRGVGSVAFRGGGGVAWRRTILLIAFVPRLATAARAQKRRAEPTRIEYDDLRQLSDPQWYEVSSSYYSFALPFS